MEDQCPNQGRNPGTTCVNRKQNGGPMSKSMAEPWLNMPQQKTKWQTYVQNNGGTLDTTFLSRKQNGGPMSRSMADPWQKRKQKLAVP